jgi:hypothetical protein
MSPSPGNARFTLRDAITTALNFVRTDTPESCTRLCAVLCCSTGCFVGLAATGFAFAHPAQTGAIVALTGIEAGLITSGCVALLTRGRPTGGAGGQNS